MALSSRKNRNLNKSVSKFGTLRTKLFITRVKLILTSWTKSRLRVWEMMTLTFNMRDSAIHVRQAVRCAEMLQVNAIFVIKTSRSQSVALAPRILNFLRVNRVTFVSLSMEIKMLAQILLDNVRFPKSLKIALNTILKTRIIVWSVLIPNKSPSTVNALINALVASSMHWVNVSSAIWDAKSALSRPIIASHAETMSGTRIYATIKARCFVSLNVL